LISDEFTGYFAGAAAAAGVLIGLLFVAVSLRPETVFGDRAMPAAKAQAGSAFTGLVNSFFVSMVALIPRASLGEVAVIMAAPGRASRGRQAVACHSDRKPSDRKPSDRKPSDRKPCGRLPVLRHRGRDRARPHRARR
jgi:hypothetical protein